MKTDRLKTIINTLKKLDNVDLDSDNFYDDTYFDGTMESIENNTITYIGDGAFTHFDKLTNISFPNVSSIGNRVFYACSSLSICNLPSITVVGEYAFSYCDALQELDFSAIKSIRSNAFSYCKSLTSVNAPNAIYIGDNAFHFCKIETINLPLATEIGPSALAYNDLVSVTLESASDIGEQAFYACHDLRTCDLYKVEKIGASCFMSCWELRAVILRSSKLVEFIENKDWDLPFVDTPVKPGGTGYIYVPKNLIEDYKDKYYKIKAQFRALEDYTVDGTVTGALDETKI